MRAVPFLAAFVVSSSAAGAAGAGTITAVGNVKALTDANQVLGVVGTGNFNEGPATGPVPLNVYSAQGLTWVEGLLSAALPGVTNTGTAVQPQYTIQYDSFFPAPIKGQGTHTGAATLYAGVATFSVAVTQVGLTASFNGTQHLTVWDKTGTMLGQVTWMPAADSSFVGIDTMGVPIAMVAYCTRDLWVGMPYDTSGIATIDDSWVWAAGAGNKCLADQQCDDGNPCTTDTCDVATGTCSYTNNKVGCSTGNACTMFDTCAGGVCVPGPNKPNGSACTDANLCMQNHVCMNGMCIASNPVTCTALDGCHMVGACVPSTGLCTNPVKVDGSACDDMNPCTKTDTCMGGVCMGTSPVMCPAPDSCHLPTTCDMTSGMCNNAALPDGTACDDGNACTQTDTCMAGVCVGGNPVDCTVKDQCHLMGMCDPTSGTCTSTNKTDGTACDDGNACTKADACQGGTCVGTKVTCAAMDSCHAAGTCDPMAGCSNPELPDGTLCPGGTCESGVCMRSSSGTGGAAATSSGSSGGHTPSKSGGCGCGVAGSQAGGAAAAALLLALAARRKRR
jgi:MYXO-CTERM domain-containing protein